MHTRSLFLFTTALSSALGEILTPAIKDPNLVWIWAAPAIVLAVQTVVFWIKYRKYDDDEFMTEETTEHTPVVSSADSVETTRGKDDEKR
jgi:cytochrome c-type biogenesis protein CcmH/NrfF